MSDKTILQLSSVSSLTGDEQVPLVQSGATKRASVTDWAAALTAFFPSASATITGVNSVNGGGTLGSGVTLQLVNDASAPGIGKYYGTDVSGTRGWYDIQAGGTVLQILTGTGLTGGPITVSGTISLADTAVVPGPYGSATAAPQINVDQQGRLISAGTVTITPAWSSITSTPTTLGGYGITDAVPNTLTVSAGSGLTGGGALSSNITLSLSNVIAAGGPTGSSSVVPVITYNAFGQLTAVSTATITPSAIGGLADPGSNGMLARTSAGVTVARTIGGGTNITVTNGDGVAGAPSVALSGQVALTNGGTGANLTASNGGIFYSTGTAGAILAGTATARQMLQSGASTTPAWSSTTWPATSTINRILYSSSANVIGEITSVNTGALVTDSSGVPAFTSGGTANRLLRTNGTAITFAQAVLTSDVSGILPGANGGTNNGFMQFSGPTTSTKTFTLPDATDTIACLGQTQSFSKAQRGTVSALGTITTSQTLDMATANNFSLTMGASSLTLNNPSNLTAGQSGSIVITQDGTGSRTLAYGSNWKFAGGVAPTLTTTAGAVDTLVYYVESATRITAQLLNNVS